MAKEMVTLNPSESKSVSFETIPYEARLYNVSVDGLSGSFRAVAPPELIAIQIVDLDTNNNGVVGSEDEAAFLAAYGSRKGEPDYDRQLDANFDGIIDSRDYDIFYRTLGKILDVIRDSIKTGIYEYLVWPDGSDAYLVALNRDRVQEFTGFRDMEGWTSIRHHPYIPNNDTKYICGMFGMDTSVASYKGLGYGCLLFAGSMLHGYNIFWLGGDWHNLNNWYILEPQNGKVFCAGAPNLLSMYQTQSISFPFERCTNEHPYPCLRSLLLAASYHLEGGGMVNYWSGLKPEYSYVKCEEPLPKTIDRAYLVGV